MATSYEYNTIHHHKVTKASLKSAAVEPWYLRYTLICSERSFKSSLSSAKHKKVMQFVQPCSSNVNWVPRMYHWHIERVLVPVDYMHLRVSLTVGKSLHIAKAEGIKFWATLSISEKGVLIHPIGSSKSS